MCFPGGQHVVVRFRLLHHQPHPFDVVPGVAPVSLCREIAEKKVALEAHFDGRHRACDFPRYEVFTADRAFVVEKDAIGSVDGICLPVIHRDPIGVKFRGA